MAELTHAERGVSSTNPGIFPWIGTTPLDLWRITPDIVVAYGELWAAEYLSPLETIRHKAREVIERFSELKAHTSSSSAEGVFLDMVEVTAMLIAVHLIELHDERHEEVTRIQDEATRQLPDELKKAVMFGVGYILVRAAAIGMAVFLFTKVIVAVKYTSLVDQLKPVPLATGLIIGAALAGWRMFRTLGWGVDYAATQRQRREAAKRKFNLKRQALIMFGRGLAENAWWDYLQTTGTQAAMPEVPLSTMYDVWQATDEIEEHLPQGMGDVLTGLWRATLQRMKAWTKRLGTRRSEEEQLLDDYRDQLEANRRQFPGAQLLSRLRERRSDEQPEGTDTPVAQKEMET